MPLSSVFSVVFFAPLVAGKFLQFSYQFVREKYLFEYLFAQPPAAVISPLTSILNTWSTAPKNTNTATRKSKVHFTWEISVSALKKPFNSTEYGSYWYKEYGCASTATNASWSALINRVN